MATAIKYFDVIQISGIDYINIYEGDVTSNLFEVIGLNDFPNTRTINVPLVSRGLLLKREGRADNVPAYSREASPFPISRAIVVPLYPRIGMPLNWPSKDSDEVLDYSLNWTQALAGDTIISSDWSISDSSLVENHSTHSSTSATIWLEDGTTNSTYTVTNTIVTAAGRTFQQSVQIRILSN